MAITHKKTGPWGLDQVYNKINQGSIWTYSGVSAFFTWGNNQHGALGQNDQTQRSSPTQVPGTTWSSISRNNGQDCYHMIASKTDGTLWAWGLNTTGQLGLNDKSQRSSPVQIGSLTDWGADAQISTGGPHLTTVIKTNGEMWAWGNNYNGMSGQNNKTDYSSPVQVPGTTWRYVNQYNSLIATKTDGTLWMWGTNSDGELGLNNRTEYSSPKQIPGSTWDTVTNHVGVSLATKTDGTLWAWGNGIYGSLGLNDRAKYSSPVQVGSDTTWSVVRSSTYSAAALKTDGTLWAWGHGDWGALGQNSRTWYSSPVQIPGTTWQYLSGGKGLYAAIKTDGTLWSWGYGSQGQLGLNVGAAAGWRSSPCQIPGLWESPIGHQRFGMAARQIL